MDPWKKRTCGATPSARLGAEGVFCVIDGRKIEKRKEHNLPLVYTRDRILGLIVHIILIFVARHCIILCNRLASVCCVTGGSSDVMVLV